MWLTLPADAPQGDQAEHKDDYDSNKDERGDQDRECRTRLLACSLTAISSGA
jgi:hypothetical protein